MCPHLAYWKLEIFFLLVVLCFGSFSDNTDDQNNLENRCWTKMLLRLPFSLPSKCIWLLFYVLSNKNTVYFLFALLPYGPPSYQPVFLLIANPCSIIKCTALTCVQWKPLLLKTNNCVSVSEFESFFSSLGKRWSDNFPKALRTWKIKYS